MQPGTDDEGTAATTEEEKSAEQTDAAGSGDEREDARSGGEGQEPESRAEQGETDSTSDGEGTGAESEQGEGSEESRPSMSGAIEDVSALPGETINDQDGRKIGEVKEIYAVGENETPMWVTIESSTGLGRSRHLFVPLARIKRQHDEIRIPYSFDHLHEAPEVEPGDELSEEDDRALRTYYAIGLADQELVENAQSYASQVPDEDEPAKKVDASSAEGPVREIDDAPPAARAAEAYEKQREEQGDEEHRSGRKATADQLFEEDGPGDGKSEDESKSEKSAGEKSEDEPKGEAEQNEKPQGEQEQDSGGEGS